MRQSADHDFWRQMERLTDPQQGDHVNGAPGFNHLPVTQAEIVADHVFLAQVPFFAVGADALT